MPRQTSPTLLLAEDNPTTRELVREIVTPAGYTLVEAATGVEALEACQRDHPPDLLLLDLNLSRTADRPGRQKLSGLDVVRQLPFFIPFIVLTVDRSTETLKSATRQGACGYLVKPVNPDTLLPAIEIALARAKEYRRREQEYSIQRAVGILMATHHIGEDQALANLKKLASEERRKVHEIAQQVIKAQRCLNRFR